MKKICTIILFALTIQSIYAQTVKYSPKFFGPNANPVPEFTDATIPSTTKLSLMGDYYFGFGDQTKNGYFKIDIPLLPQRVSFKIWTTIFENYKTTDSISAFRNSLNGNTQGNANGDFYVQTRILITKETKKRPAIILNSTLKTASGTKFNERRYFDTPGYYFDAEIGKSFYTKSTLINEIRTVANAGFMCWETTNSTQNDAPLYGAKIIIGNEYWKLENSLSGYFGWMHTHPKYGADYGDDPLVYSAKILLMNKKKVNYFAQYQYGIRNYPYHMVRLGVTFSLDKLTPDYKKITN